MAQELRCPVCDELIRERTIALPGETTCARCECEIRLMRLNNRWRIIGHTPKPIPFGLEIVEDELAIREMDGYRDRRVVPARLAVTIRSKTADSWGHTFLGFLWNFGFLAFYGLVLMKGPSDHPVFPVVLCLLFLHLAVGVWFTRTIGAIHFGRTTLRIAGDQLIAEPNSFARTKPVSIALSAVERVRATKSAKLTPETGWSIEALHDGKRTVLVRMLSKQAADYLIRRIERHLRSAAEPPRVRIARKFVREEE